MTSLSHEHSQELDVSENSGFSPQIIHFNRVFHYFHHPFLDTTILGNPQDPWIRDHPVRWFAMDAHRAHGIFQRLFFVASKGGGFWCFGVSENSFFFFTPKSSIFRGFFSIIFTIHFGFLYPYFWKDLCFFFLVNSHSNGTSVSRCILWLKFYWTWGIDSYVAMVVYQRLFFVKALSGWKAKIIWHLVF